MAFSLALSRWEKIRFLGKIPLVRGLLNLAMETLSMLTGALATALEETAARLYFNSNTPSKLYKTQRTGFMVQTSNKTRDLT
jgi:hypothetical protein